MLTSLCDIGTQIDAEAEEKRVVTRMGILMRISAETGVHFWADEKRCRSIVQFQDRASQAREFIEYCRSSLAMVYSAMFPRNPQPGTLAELMKVFRKAKDIHRFVKVQLVAGAKLALAWTRTHHPKLDLDTISQGFPPRRGKSGIRMTRHYDAAAVPAERMIARLLEADSEFFTKFHYDEGE